MVGDNGPAPSIFVVYTIFVDDCNSRALLRFVIGKLRGIHVHI